MDIANSFRDNLLVEDRYRMSLDSLIRICKELQIDPKSFIDACSRL